MCGKKSPTVGMQVSFWGSCISPSIREGGVGVIFIGHQLMAMGRVLLEENFRTNHLNMVVRLGIGELLEML